MGTIIEVTGHVHLQILHVAVGKWSGVGGGGDRCMEKSLYLKTQEHLKQLT